MREMIRMRKILEEMNGQQITKALTISKISKICNDNQAALKHTIIDMPKLGSRSKRIGIQHHWFRRRLEPGSIECHPINTRKQKVDIMTKGLVVKTRG